MTNLADSIALALRHHQRGELAEAETIYRHVLGMMPENADAWHLLGLAAHQSGRHEDAVALITRALAIDESKAIAQKHLGAAYLSLGRRELAETAFQRAVALDESDAQSHAQLAELLLRRNELTAAAAHYRTAIALDGTLVGAHFNLGQIARSRSDWSEAAACYQKVLDLQPTMAEAQSHLAAALAQLGRDDEAVALWQRALTQNPRNAEAHYRLGSLHHRSRQLDEAESALRSAVAIDPCHADAWNNLGCVLRDKHLADNSPEDSEWTVEAEQCFRQSLANKPDSPQVLANLGAMLAQRKQFAAAIESYQAALRLDLSLTDTLVNLGHALHMVGRTDEAIISLREALVRRPDHAQAHYALGAALQFKGQLPQALASFEESIRLDPQCVEAYCNRGFALLAMGRFAEGWQDHAWRLKSKHNKTRQFDVPQWDGAPLAGRTLLVHAEQGFGDTIQFIRFIPLLTQQGARVILEVQPALVPLLASSGFGHLVPQGAPLPPFDLHLPMLSLPEVLGTRLQTLPAKVPYLAADRIRAAQWHAMLPGKPAFRIGISWQGNLVYDFDHVRSLPLAQFAPLAEVPGVRLISLQKNAGSEQLSALSGRFDVLDLGPQLDARAPFMDTAAVMLSLDLVVTSDTAIAHLAGALGRPVWLALSTAPSWRWMIKRTDSPWYPTMRLFRQPKLGDWESVFRAMARQLNSQDDSPRGAAPARRNK